MVKFLRKRGNFTGITSLKAGRHYHAGLAGEAVNRIETRIGEGIRARVTAGKIDYCRLTIYYRSGPHSLDSFI